MEFAIPIILIVAAGGYLALAHKRRLFPFKPKIIGTVRSKGDIEKALANLGIPYPGDVMAAATTPKGARVTSTVIVPQVALDTIDAGLDELFARYRAAYPAWSKAFSHAEYAVLFIDPMATNQDGSPAIKVQGQQSAGTCIGFPFPMAYLVLPHQQERGWIFKDYLFNSVFNEGEHFIESHNSREVFDRYTGLQDTHPHVM